MLLDPGMIKLAGDSNSQEAVARGSSLRPAYYIERSWFKNKTKIESPPLLGGGVAMPSMSEALGSNSLLKNKTINISILISLCQTLSLGLWFGTAVSTPVK